MPITWPTPCHVIISPHSSPSTHMQLLSHHPSPLTCWTSYWIRQPIGHLCAGAVSSTLLSRWISTIHAENLPSSHESFHSFCMQYNVTQPFPLTERLLCIFAAYLADQGLAPQTGKSYLLALRNMQISLGLPDPRKQSSLPILKRVQAGISRARVLKGSPPRICLPITVSILGAIHQSLETSTNPDKAVFWAVASAALFGFFRLGELLLDAPSQFNPATWGDVAVDSHTNPSMVQFHLKISKCHQFGSGSDVMDSPLCPVSAVLKYIEVRGDAPGPFFQGFITQCFNKAKIC